MAALAGSWDQHLAMKVGAQRSFALSRSVQQRLSEQASSFLHILICCVCTFEVAMDKHEAAGLPAALSPSQARQLLAWLHQTGQPLHVGVLAWLGDVGG